MKEFFDKNDIATYENYVVNEELKSGLRVTYEFDKFKLPEKLFTTILYDRRPDLLKFCPYEVKVKRLNRGNNPWLQETNYLGLNTGERLELFLSEDGDHPNVELLWILFHEFRHKIQELNLNIRSVTNTPNMSYFYKYFSEKGNTEDIVNHVYHELLPFEVDANVFASEILNIKNPGSKFTITEDVFLKLK